MRHDRSRRGAEDVGGNRKLSVEPQGLRLERSKADHRLVEPADRIARREEAKPAGGGIMQFRTNRDEGGGGCALRVVFARLCRKRAGRGFGAGS